MSETRENTVHAPGKTLVLISGIYYIIIGTMTAIVTVLAFTSTSSNVLAFSFLMDAIVMLLVGILGVKYCKKLEKAQTLRALGILAIVWEVFSPFTFSDGNFLLFQLYVGIDSSTLAFLFIPIFYFVGARQNVRAQNAILEPAVLEESQHCCEEEPSQDEANEKQSESTE